MLLSLSFQVGQRVLVGGEGSLVVLHEVRQAEIRVHGRHLQALLLIAEPLPSGMDALRVWRVTVGLLEGLEALRLQAAGP